MRFSYDIAISFANEDRKHAIKFATILFKKYKLRVFYDDFEQANLTGRNLTEYLIDVYMNRAMFCVVLVSKWYRKKRWTTHEWRAAQARAFEEPDERYIIPIKVDEIELPGLLPTVGFLSLRKLTHVKISRMIFDMVKEDIKELNKVRQANNLYSHSKFIAVIKLLGPITTLKNVEGLRIIADSYEKLHDYPNSIMATEKIIQKVPKDFMAHFLLGIRNYRIRDFKKSVKHYKIANKIFPDHPTVKGDLPAAIAMLKKQMAKLKPMRKNTRKKRK